MRSKILISLALAACAGSMWLLVRLYRELASLPAVAAAAGSQYAWVPRLLVNCAGYATVLLPGYLLYKYLQRTNHFDKPVGDGPTSRALFACFGEPDEKLPEVARLEEAQGEAIGGSARLAVCFGGLVGAYLVWGLLQEKIMTQGYTLSDGETVRFRDSQFLVFINRLAALLTALTRLLCARRPLVAAPLYEFSYCSLTNVISAWCQYEALKYVSFPTQVLSKSCKVIPVMLMSRLVSGARHHTYEYASAAAISLGMLLFTLSADDRRTTSAVSGLSGALLLCLYLSCDSFTSSWQGALFRRRGPTPMQMMLAVNLFSCALTAAALLQQPDTRQSVLLLRHPVFLTDCALLSASSTVGQLFIYYTIAHFGAVVFTIIMTLRQAVSILLSCLVYGHEVSRSGVSGVLLVFSAVLFRMYCRRRLQKPDAI